VHSLVDSTGSVLSLSIVNAGATAGPASDAVDDVEEFALELSSEAGYGNGSD